MERVFKALVPRCKNLFPLIIIKLEIALIKVSMLLMTNDKESTNIEIVKMELYPVIGFNNREKKTVLGSLALPNVTARIPKKPRTKRNGKIIKKAEAKPIVKSLSLLAAYTLCHTP